MARALKLVEVYCWTGKDWASDQLELLDPKNRASPDAEIQFSQFVSQSVTFTCATAALSDARRKTELL